MPSKTSTTTSDVAVSRCIATVNEFIAKIQRKEGNTDIESAIGEWISHFRSDVGTDVDEEALAEAAASLGTILTQAETMIAKPGTDHSLVVRVARNRLSVVQAHLTRAAGTFSRQAELDAGRQALVEAETDLAKIRSRVDQAIEADDVDAVLALRTDLAVRAPKRIAEAGIAVVDLEIAKALERAAGPRRRLDEVRARKTTAEKALEDARAKLANAEAELLSATAAERTSQSVVHQLEQAAQTLKADRDQLMADSKTAGKAALRTLAGLPTTDDEDTAGRLVEEAAAEDARARAAGRTFFRRQPALVEATR
jgi:uncharacterized protein YbcI